MPIPPGKLVGDLRRLRRLRRLTQEDVARRTGRAMPRINEVERGKTDPRLSTLLAIARALDAELVAVPREQLAAVRQLTEASAAAAPAGDVYDEVFVPDPASDEPAGAAGTGSADKRA